MGRGAVVAISAVAWVATVLRMRGMDAGPGTDPGSLGFYVTTWAVMMAAMMLPSLVPVVLAHRQAARSGAARRRWSNWALFVAGYLLLWTAAGIVFYVALEGGRALGGGVFDWTRAGRWVAAAVIVAAALYELTPVKRDCLARCRSRETVALEPARSSAIVSGIAHGTWCLGCCWALMAALFALGAMSITWMVVISALIAIEKLLPWQVVGSGAVAVVLATLAVGVAAVPHEVPALTVPGATAMHTMGMPR